MIYNGESPEQEILARVKSEKLEEIGKYQPPAKWIKWLLKMLVTTSGTLKLDARREAQEAQF